MNNEVPHQWNMFTGELDDNRTARQKKNDRERQQPQQIEMFAQREIAQFGVNAHPLLPLSPNTKLGLIFEDLRTEEEKELDRQRAAEERTYKMFGGTPVLDTRTGPEKILALVPYHTPCMALMIIEKVCRAVVPVGEVTHE